jgi:type IV pilus assembly protein PilX
MNSLMYCRQKGSALIISLVFLVVLTVLSVAAMQGTTMQERMAVNYRESNEALQAAEAALRTAERYLELAVIGPFDGSVTGLYEPITGTELQTAVSNGTPVERWEAVADSGWLAVPGTSYKGQEPEYIIEQMRAYKDPLGSLAADEPLPENQYYRITARGYGASGELGAILQSTYRRQ